MGNETTRQLQQWPDRNHRQRGEPLQARKAKGVSEPTRRKMM